METLKVNDNKFIHSYWTAPALDRRWSVNGVIQTITNMWYFATSVAYLKKLGQKIVLHTDTLGKTILDHIPYDEITLTLDDIPKWMHTMVWACGKMYAIEKEPLGSIHIDGDVFFKKPTAVNLVKNFIGDAMVQNLESKLHSAPAYTNAMGIMQHLPFPEGTTNRLNSAYNTGVLCFKNQEFKDKFLSTYFNMAERVSKDPKCVESLNKDKYCAPDIILEQQFIYELSKDKYKVRTLLHNGFEKQFPQEIGYQHVIGSKKYLQLHHCKRVLKELDENLYNACLQKQLDIESGKIQLSNGN